MKWPEERPHATVPRGRNIEAHRRIGVCMHWRALAPDEVRDGVTSPLRTVLDCARDLAREAHDRDCWRDNALVLAGWKVLRFTWEQVMRRQEGVVTALRTAAGAAGSGGRSRLG